MHRSKELLSEYECDKNDMVDVGVYMMYVMFELMVWSETLFALVHIEKYENGEYEERTYQICTGAKSFWVSMSGTKMTKNKKQKQKKEITKKNIQNEDIVNYVKSM